MHSLFSRRQAQVNIRQEKYSLFKEFHLNLIQNFLSGICTK